MPAAPAESPADKICRNAAVVGALSLLPVPLVDLWLQGRVLRALYEGIARDHEITLEESVLDVLTGFRGSYMMGCLSGVLWLPIKMLFRKIIYVFAVKDAFDSCVDAGLRAEMLRRALRAGALPAEADAVRTLMDQSLRRHGGSPVWGAVAGHAPVAALQGATGLSKAVAGLAQRGRGAAVLARFDEGLAQVGAPAPAPATAPVAAPAPPPAPVP